MSRLTVPDSERFPRTEILSLPLVGFSESLKAAVEPSWSVRLPKKLSSPAVEGEPGAMREPQAAVMSAAMVAAVAPPPSRPLPLASVSGTAELNDPPSARTYVGVPVMVADCRLMVLPAMRRALFKVPLFRLMLVMGAAAEPMLWPDILSVPPSRVRVVMLGLGLPAVTATVVLASRMSVLMLAVPPLMMNVPREGPAAALPLVRLARKN